MIPKFRAWEMIHQYMFNPFALVFNESGSIEIDDGMDMFSTDNVILMQSTGVKDINGKEIFEGDIIKITSIFYGDTNVDYVVYKDGYFGLSRDSVSPICLMSCIYEVIGNIYENTVCKEV